jgi:outer membrane lipoprotein SlyB
MKNVMMTAAVAAGLTLTGCATNDPYYGQPSSQAQRAVTGGAVGAAVGAGLGAVVGGVSPVEGAIAGGIAGAVLGAVINNKQYYRDTQGACYYVDQYGRPVYDYNVRC